MALLPTLFLTIEQGPKAGCRLECSAVAISSVGRGRSNTLQISRDTGISQKHLRFQWRDGDEDNDAYVGWAAMDVGSSNGTVINGVLVESNKEIYIHTGDLIKIGSETTIRVEILGVAADEVAAAPKYEEYSERKGSCVASECHGKGMSVVVGRHSRKAGKTAGKAFAAQGCQSKRLDVMEVEVHHGEHHVHNEAKDHVKQKDDMTDEAYNGKQHSNIAGGSKTTLGHHEDKHDIDDEAAERQEVKGCSTTAQVKHGTNSMSKKKQDNIAEKSGDHDHKAENLAEPANIDLSVTVEQWFWHLMEEGPKYLHRVSEKIIQDVMLESKQFDEYVLSLS